MCRGRKAQNHTDRIYPDNTLTITPIQQMLKVLTSHPIQYQVPLFREMIANGQEISVAYFHGGMAGQSTHDLEFGIDFQWDIDLLSGYPHFFLSQHANHGLAEQIRIAPKLLSWGLQDRKTPLLLIGWFAEVVWLLWLLRLMVRAPVLTMSENTPLSYRAVPKPRWRQMLLGWLLRHSAAHLSVGSRNREFLLNMGVQPRQIYSTPHSIDNSRFAASAAQLRQQRSALCLEHGIDPSTPVFLFCGKLIAKKRPLQLLDAFIDAGLHDKAQLIFVGEGILRDTIVQRIRDLNLNHVHVLGFLNQTEMPLAYVLGEILCLVSDPTETWGLVVNEAFACGRPAIVSDVTGCGPDLIDSSTGWIVPLDNHKALSCTLLDAYNQYDSWPMMGLEGQKRIANHTFSSMVQGISDALTSVKR